MAINELVGLTFGNLSFPSNLYYANIWIVTQAIKDFCFFGPLGVVGGDEDKCTATTLHGSNPSSQRDGSYFNQEIISQKLQSRKTQEVIQWFVRHWIPIRTNGSGIFWVQILTDTKSLWLAAGSDLRKGISPILKVLWGQWEMICGWLALTIILKVRHREKKNQLHGIWHII